MDLNKKFRTYVVESDKVAELVVHLLCYCLDAKDKPGSSESAQFSIPLRLMIYPDCRATRAVSSNIVYPSNFIC